jgi:hypothetical protein
MSERPSVFDDPGFLRAILNLVIPPEGGMPGAGDLGLGAEVAGSLGHDPATAAGLDAIQSAASARDPGGLAALPESAALDVAQSLAADYPALMPTLARVTALAYYQHPEVLVAIGEPARPPFPEGFELDPISPEWLALLERRAQRP